MTVKEAAHLIKQSIQDIYDSREINAITEWILEDLTGLKRVDRILFDGDLNVEQLTRLNIYIEKLAIATPVQYVTGYAWFFGKKLSVNEHVLIPRPETEELVEWALENVTTAKKVVDIGTGSGCIPVLIKHEKQESNVFGIDVSAEALHVAQKNAQSFGAEVTFLELNILDSKNWNSLPVFDIIISNPPYIPLSDKDTMDKHVVEHEPHLALFVPDNDPLIFYRAIIMLAETKLHPGGKIFFETHNTLAKDVSALTTWPSEIRLDASGKERMVCITKS